MTLTDAPRNAWRLESPGPVGAGSVKPGAADKLLMVSADCHANEPSSYLADYIEPQYLERIPRMQRDDECNVCVMRSRHVFGREPRRIGRSVHRLSTGHVRCRGWIEHVRSMPELRRRRPLYGRHV